MNPIERTARRIDGAQQRHRPFAFIVGVIRKFGDDRGGALSALLAFYGFLSLFPLLLVMVTILGFFHPAEHSLLQRTESAAFSQFPIVGTKLSQNIHALHGRSTLGLVVGIAGVLWGSQGALQTAQYAQAEVWNVPGEARPNFWTRLGRTAAMTVLLGVFLLTSTVVAGVVTIGHHGLWALAGAFVVSLALNVCLFAVAFRVLTPRQIDWRDMLPGSVVGGAGWTLLQYLGGLLIEHSLRNTGKEYGTFALVLGLVGFLYLASEVTVYAAEVNVVKARHLWPRGVVQPPLTEADREVLSSIVLEGKRRPEQRVSTGFGDLEADRSSNPVQRDDAVSPRPRSPLAPSS
jgi:YihY family inner membrane protein